MIGKDGKDGKDGKQHFLIPSATRDLLRESRELVE
jgi:hypothetical protein